MREGRKHQALAALALVALVAAAAGAAEASRAVKRPDLIEAAVSNPPATAAAGSSFSAHDTARNRGVARSRSSSTPYSLRGGGKTVKVGARRVAALKRHAASAGSARVTVPASI